MSGLFGKPKAEELAPPPPPATPSPPPTPYSGPAGAGGDLARRLAAGGSNSTNLSSTIAPTSLARPATLTGLS